MSGVLAARAGSWSGLRAAITHTEKETATMKRSSMGKHRLGLASVLAAAGVMAVLLPVVLSGASAGAAGNMSAEAKALAKLDDDWAKAAAARDVDRVASFYAEDGIAYPPNEPVAVGRAAARKTWAAYFADPTFTISWKTTHAEVTGDLGYTAGTYEDSFKGPDGKIVNEKGKYLCVWKKMGDGTWKAVHDMWNTDSR